MITHLVKVLQTVICQPDLSRGYCLPMFGSTDVYYTLGRQVALTKIAPFHLLERQKLWVGGQETYAAF